MKHIVKYCVLAALPLLATACIDNVPTEEELPRDAVSFEYVIEGDYALDYYVGSTITFTNTSPTEGEAVWDFGDGTQMTGDRVEKYYDEAGTYTVKLTVGGLQKTNVIMISDIKPRMTINPIEGGLCEVNTSVVTFSLQVPNPRNYPLEYKWMLPAGTKNAQGELVEVSTDTLPGELMFANVGSQTVRLQVKLNGRALEEAMINVQVGYNKEVPTLYYAVQGGNLMAYKLINDAPEDMQIAPFDLGISSGQHPFNLLFGDSSVYVLDCGKQFYYVDDADGVMGDGKISVVAKDGSKLETMITNAGQAAFDDPFFGFIEGDNLYYANRNTGIMKLPLKTRNAVYSKTEHPYFVQHTTLGYYNNGWTYGAIGGCFGKVGDTWYWSKFYSGNGFYRFTESDILSAPTAGGETAPAAGIALAGMWPKSFAYDAQNDAFYFTLMDVGYAGVYKCTLAQLDEIGSSKKNLAPYLLKYEGLGFECDLSGDYRATEGYSSEPVGICQMALDEATKCVYFAFRNPTNDPSLAPSGVYRYNPTTAKIEAVVQGVNVYGLTINQTPSKLF